MFEAIVNHKLYGTLNEQQRAFCIAYASGSDPAEAILKAGYKCSPESARVMGYRLLKNPTVCAVLCLPKPQRRKKASRTETEPETSVPPIVAPPRVGFNPAERWGHKFNENQVRFFQGFRDPTEGEFWQDIFVLESRDEAAIERFRTAIARNAPFSSAVEAKYAHMDQPA